MKERVVNNSSSLWKEQGASLRSIYSEHLSWCEGLKGPVGQGFSSFSFSSSLWDLFPIPPSLTHSFSVAHSLWGKIPEIWIRIAPQRIHDLISMCHSDLIGLDTTSEDLRGLKMFLFDSVCLAVIGRDNEALVAERVKALWSKTTSTSPSSRTKKNSDQVMEFSKETWKISVSRYVWCLVIGFLHL